MSFLRSHRRQSGVLAGHGQIQAARATPKSANAMNAFLKTPTIRRRWSCVARTSWNATLRTTASRPCWTRDTPRNALPQRARAHIKLPNFPRQTDTVRAKPRGTGATGGHHLTGGRAAPTASPAALTREVMGPIEN